MGVRAAPARPGARSPPAGAASAAHADVELHLDPDELTSPWQAAAASAVAFTVGSLLPLGAILLPPPGIRVLATFLMVIVALAATGYLSARLGSARPGRAVARLVIGGAAGMAVTYGIGTLVGTAVG